MGGAQLAGIVPGLLSSASPVCPCPSPSWPAPFVLPLMATLPSPPSCIAYTDCLASPRLTDRLLTAHLPASASQGAGVARAAAVPGTLRRLPRTNHGGQRRPRAWFWCGKGHGPSRCPRAAQVGVASCHPDPPPREERAWSSGGASQCEVAAPGPRGGRAGPRAPPGCSLMGLLGCRVPRLSWTPPTAPGSSQDQQHSPAPATALPGPSSALCPLYSCWKAAPTWELLARSLDAQARGPGPPLPTRRSWTLTLGALPGCSPTVSLQRPPGPLSLGGEFWSAPLCPPRGGPGEAGLLPVHTWLPSRPPCSLDI